MVYAGDGDAEKIREIRNSLNAELIASYETFDRNEMPKDMLAGLEDVAEVRVGQRPEVIQVGFMQGPFPKIPVIPEIKMPDLGKHFNLVIPSPVQSKTSGRTEDLPPDTEIRIEHLKGNITIHGWENNYIEYENVRGGIDLKEGVMSIGTSGDCSFKIPRDTSSIALNFVNGNAGIFDIASSLRISGVKGNIDIVAAEVPDDVVMDISLVNGNINLTIPDDSSCSIHAETMSDEIFSSDLTFQRSVGDKNQLSAVMNDGKASINLKTVKGKISILGKSI
jgi:hypothetical protein